ncbi:MAG: NADH-ubiquinone oxidoreductase-F iron-sulfur binding region domain-containing protein [Candidatus Falkowbacteria bacterium]
MASDIISKISQANLHGRGGAGFPVAIKWQAVKDALVKDKKSSYYIVINAAEGEPGVKKDAYILENHANLVLEGVKASVDALGFKRLAGIYCFINHEYYKLYAKKINKLLNSHQFLALKIFWHFSLKPQTLSYISGEETAILNIIEGKRHEPRLKPPLPVNYGLWGLPTLVNNVETFYQVALVKNNLFDSRRFYTINGEIARPGVYHLPDDWKIEDVLRLTGNWPSYKFFVQVGGDVSGEVLNSTQLNKTVGGSGSITVYSWFDHSQEEMIGRWLNFFKEGSCGKCTPCREGTYRLLELFEAKKTYSPEFWDVLELLKEGSFCAYGKSIALPLSSYYKNILKIN